MPNESILIVEDTPVNMKLVRVLLSRHGFDVHTAATAEEALQVLREFRPRLILTDVQLPGMSGLDLTRKVKSDPSMRDVKILALTAFAMKKDEENAYAAGCDGYITKPIDTRTFPSLIRQYLERGPGAKDRVDTTEEPGGPSLREIRHEFLTDGARQAVRLLSTPGASLDAEEMQVIAHRWAGAAGSVGYPQITQAARELETVLEQNGSGASGRARELLERVARLFAAAQAAEDQPPRVSSSQLSGHVAEPATQPESADAALGLLAARQEAPSPAVLSVLAGKRFALAGFPPNDASRLAKALDACQAFSRDLGAGAMPDAEAVRPFDVVILNVGSETSTVPSWNKPVLIIGPREALVRLQPVHNGTEDFLFSPWTAEEVILRSFFAVSRAAQKHTTQPAPAADGKRRVVVADDDSTIRSLVEAAVGRAGFECRVATDGSAALETIRTWQPDLAVLDVNMPNRSGFEVLSALRSDPLTREIRVILLTARQQETDVIRGFGLGADDYVIKPFSPMELIARMKRLLGKNA